MTLWSVEKRYLASNPRILSTANGGPQGAARPIISGIRDWRFARWRSTHESWRGELRPEVECPARTQSRLTELRVDSRVPDPESGSFERSRNGKSYRNEFRPRGDGPV